MSQIETFEQPAEHDPHEVHGEPENPEQLIAEYEAAPADYAENDDGPTSDDDEREEDWGIDDEDAGEEEYKYEEGYEEQGYEEGGYEEQGYEEEGYEDPEGAPEDDIHIEHEDNLDETGGLLADVPIQVVVELGRVQLTADEIIRLRAGHLMELGRSPADPVDLVVNGKLLAKGELVEIEGTLGVKILTLGKEPES